MPLAMAGPPPLNAPPLPGIPFTVSNGLTASKSHTIAPSLVEYARRCPPKEAENAIPGIAETADDCARLPAPCGAGVLQIFSPVAMLRAYSPGVPSGLLISAIAA